MTMFKCPGAQWFRQPKPNEIKCPYCGKDIEIWSDESKATCPGCKKEVIKMTEQSCLDWCTHAKECLGDGLYEKFKEEKKRQKKEKGDER